MQKTFNRKLVIYVAGIKYTSFCVSAKGLKIKLVVFDKQADKRTQVIIKRAIAAYNRQELSVMINDERLWFNVFRYDRNIPMNEIFD